MTKLRLSFYLFLAMLDCFILGNYCCAQFIYNKPVELYRWAITSLFCAFFLIAFLTDYEKYIKNKKQ